MAFTDIKCLESLLIEGEELIATEGFIDTIKNVFGDRVSFCNGCSKCLATKLKI